MSEARLVMPRAGIVIPVVQAPILPLRHCGGDTLGLLPAESKHLQFSELQASIAAGQFDDSIEDDVGDQFEDAEDEPSSFEDLKSLSTSTQHTNLVKDACGSPSHEQRNILSKPMVSSPASSSIRNSEVASKTKRKGAAGQLRLKDKLNSNENPTARVQESLHLISDDVFCGKSVPQSEKAQGTQAVSNSIPGQAAFLTSNDVVFGQDKSVPSPGNVFFRRLVRVKQNSYRNARGYEEKQAIEKFIFDVIRGLAPPGKFFKPNQQNVLEELDESRSLEMVSKALVNGVVVMQISRLKVNKGGSLHASKSFPHPESPNQKRKRVNNDGDEGDKKLKATQAGELLPASAVDEAEVGFNPPVAAQIPTPLPTAFAASVNHFPASSRLAYGLQMEFTPGASSANRRISYPHNFLTPIAPGIPSDSAFDPTQPRVRQHLPSCESQAEQVRPDLPTSVGELNSSSNKSRPLSRYTPQSMYIKTSSEGELKHKNFVPVDEKQQALFLSQENSQLGVRCPLFHRVVSSNHG